MRRVLLLASVLASLAACNPQPPDQPEGKPAPSPTPTGLPPLRISGQGTQGHPIVMTMQNGNRKNYVVVGHSLVSHSAQVVLQTTFQQAQVTFYDKDGTTLTAQAPRAVVDQKARQVILSGGVHAKTSAGQKLTCDRLVYDQSTGLLHGQGHVRMTGSVGGEAQVLTGSTFVSNVNLSRISVR